MPERISRIGKGTIGSRRCEEALNRILIGYNNAKLTGKVMRCYSMYRNGVQSLQVLRDDPMYREILRIWRERYIQRAHELELPEEVASHLCCCIVAEYRDALRRLK